MVTIGIGCIAEFETVPYRAEVIAMKSADQVELIFVDYGNYVVKGGAQKL